MQMKVLFRFFGRFVSGFLEIPDSQQALQCRVFRTLNERSKPDVENMPGTDVSGADFLGSRLDETVTRHG